jgi:hypothetical protein
MREVRGAQPARLMHLGEEDFAVRPVLATPLPHAPLQGASALRPIAGGVLPLEPLQEGLGLESGLGLEQFLQSWPDVGQGIGTSPPGMWGGSLAGELLCVAILACGFAVHACLHRCERQRRSLPEGGT